MLDLKQLITELEARTGIGGRVLTGLPADAAQITVLRSDQLELAQDAFTLLDVLPIISVVLSLALFGIALAVAPGWRRQAVRGYGFGLVAAGVAALATRSLAGDAIVDSLVPTEAGVPAAREVWAIVTELLDAAAVAAIFYGAVLILGAWLAGATRPATAVRRVARRTCASPRSRTASSPSCGRRGAVVGADACDAQSGHRDPARGPVRAGFEGLRRQTAREFPDADRHEFQQRTRERLARSYEAVRERTASGGAAVARRTSALRSEPAGEGRPLPRRPTRARPARAARTTAHDRRARRAEFRAEKARILGDTGDTGGAPVAPEPPAVVDVFGAPASASTRWAGRHDSAPVVHLDRAHVGPAGR